MNDAMLGRRVGSDAQVTGMPSPEETVDLAPDTPITEEGSKPDGGDLDLAHEAGGVDLGEM
ncbi:hypothetical protein [Glaciihabitans sp. dw_435]|uniref:hypothetical protein n=1 Tax=Glaciihabitans sp. dw_435 TaxID=2720081 RepID=UPI001BD2BEA5|nr:hypothetical protein [Glaciihabitans sp. dw_435]